MLKEPIRQMSSALNARANLMKEQRLAQQTAHKMAVAQEVERQEAKLPKTSQSLDTLGAGKPYGAS